MEQLKICPSKIICIRYRSVSRTLRENCQEVSQLSLEGEHKSPSTTRFGGRDINDNIFPNFNARVMFQTSQFQNLNRFSPQLPKES